MDITSYVLSGRNEALLYGDYSTYYSQLSRKLLNIRKRLGTVTRNRGKFQKKPPVTSEDVARDHESLHLLLLTSERAWAQAMAYKATHSADEKGIAGRSKTQIVSRLRRANVTAEHIVRILSESNSPASTTDLLEAKAYAGLISGAMLFEQRNWSSCLSSYAVARVAYTALSTTTKSDLFKDLLSETIDPSIRFAAYQLKTPRTVPISTIVLKAFPDADPALKKDVNSLDSTVLNPQSAAAADAGEDGVDQLPKNLTWRSREVKIEHAQIAETWGKVLGAKKRLSEHLATSKETDPRGIAAAYEEILMLSQDAVTSTKEAIDELRSEGVGSGDPRMQSLQITRTAVNYEMISWRIGRNRVLIGSQDGAVEDYSSTGKSRKKAKAKAKQQEEHEQRELPISKKLKKLKERAALYDGTLQNLSSVKDLPGIANDTALATKIESYRKYFEALKCLSIARSHAVVGNDVNALALINHSSKLCREAAVNITAPPDSSPVNIDVAAEDVAFLGRLLEGELQRHRAIVHIDNLRKEGEQESSTKTSTPLLERLNEYPVGGVDLKNIVQYPPKIELIPASPIFLDVAWNYISYPGKEPKKAAASTSSGQTAPAAAESTPSQPAKKGWFGFGGR